jgi:pimeloyl-ACP methyl ester carboxylesterase
MSEYAKTVSEIIEQTESYENSLPLRNEACRSRFFFQSQPTEKVCLFLHGFTAAPYQFVPMGEAFFQDGCNVIIPLMPGHGRAGEWNSNNPPPLPTDAIVYQEFVLQWLQQAQTLGKKVIVAGLSTGATLAAWLNWERSKEIDRTLLFAPYLSSSVKLVDFLVEILPCYFEWFNRDAAGNFGYDGFSLPALGLFYTMGQEILDRASLSSPAPTFIFSSASDLVVNNYDHQVLFETALQKQPLTWYHCFERALNIGHRMMTKREDNQYQDLTIALAKAFVNSNLTWTEVLKLGDRILHGKTYEESAIELNLGDRITPELSVLMTMLDIQAIVNASKYKN